MAKFLVVVALAALALSVAWPKPGTTNTSLNHHAAHQLAQLDAE